MVAGQLFAHFSIEITTESLSIEITTERISTSLPTRNQFRYSNSVKFWSSAGYEIVEHLVYIDFVSEAVQENVGKLEKGKSVGGRSGEYGARSRPSNPSSIDFFVINKTCGRAM